MRNYFRNLFTALAGNNPYQMELDRVREEYEKTAERVEQLDELYYTIKGNLAQSDARLADYQQLVENLRRRIVDKDDLIGRMREEASRIEADYRRRLADYGETVGRLQAELKKSRKKLIKAKR